jgi:hypothetical protein
MKKPISPKPRAVRVTEPDKIAAVIVRGKYREDRPHFERQKDGALLVEVKP